MGCLESDDGGRDRTVTRGRKSLTPHASDPLPTCRRRVGEAGAVVLSRSSRCGAATGTHVADVKAMAIAAASHYTADGFDFLVRGGRPRMLYGTEPVNITRVSVGSATFGSTAAQRPIESIPRMNRRTSQIMGFIASSGVSSYSWLRWLPRVPGSNSFHGRLATWSPIAMR